MKSDSEKGVSTTDKCHFCLKRWGAFEPEDEYGKNVRMSIPPGISFIRQQIPICEKHVLELISPGPFI